MEKTISRAKLAFIIVVSIICLVVPVTTGVVIGIQRNQATAIKSSDTTNCVEIGEIWSAEAKIFYHSKLNALTNTLSTAYTSDSDYTASDIRSLTGGKTVLVTLGGLQWQVVYLTNNASGQRTATLWLEDSTQSEFTKGTVPSGVKYAVSSNGALTSTWSNGYYDSGSNWTSAYPSSMYGMSYIRAVTLNNGGKYWNGTSNGSNSSATATATQVTDGTHIFSKFTVATAGDNNDLTDYIVRPNAMPYQTTSQGNSVLGYTLMNDSLATNLTGYYSSKNFQKVSGYTNWGNDCLWLPSMQEMGYSDSKLGIWKLSVNERGQTTDAYSWSRSSYYFSSFLPCVFCKPLWV